MIPVFHRRQFFHHFIDGMIVIRGHQHRTVVEERRNNGIDYCHRLAGARRPLYIGDGITHGMVHCQKLIQIYPAAYKGKGIGFPLS